MRRFARLLIVPALAVLVASAPGAVPAQGASIPIDHVVVLMQENRSFDHYLGQLCREGLPPPDGFTQKTIFEELDAAGISWKIYYSQVPFAYEFSYVRNHPPGNVVPIDQYYADAANGTLPQVAYVDPIFLGPSNVENDEHPPSNVQVGERFVSDVTNALMSSPNWSSSALFLTYDEHGGFYDHVAPPPAPV